MRRKNVELWMPKSPLEVLVDVQLQVKVSGGGVLPHKRLMGMCRWMGLHFLNWPWSDYNGVANFRILGISRDSKWEDSRLKKSCINRKRLSWDRENYVFQKVTKMGSVIGQKIDYLTIIPRPRMGYIDSEAIRLEE